MKTNKTNAINNTIKMEGFHVYWIAGEFRINAGFYFREDHAIEAVSELAHRGESLHYAPDGTLDIYTLIVSASKKSYKLRHCSTGKILTDANGKVRRFDLSLTNGVVRF